MSSEDRNIILKSPINICPKCNATLDTGVVSYRDGGTRKCKKCGHIWHQCAVHKDKVHVPGKFVWKHCSCVKIDIGISEYQMQNMNFEEFTKHLEKEIVGRINNEETRLLLRKMIENYCNQRIGDPKFATELAEYMTKRTEIH